MDARPRLQRRPSVCPHDCPSSCALDVEVIDGRTIGRVRGARDQSYTDGIICAKVARYAERIHHPDRLTQPLRRTGPKGSGRFEPIGWDAALDEIAARFLAAEAADGPEAVWPYYYAGTRAAHYADGFAWPDGRFRFRPDWGSVPNTNAGHMGDVAGMPALPDHWAVIEAADDAHPFRRPARRGTS